MLPPARAAAFPSDARSQVRSDYCGIPDAAEIAVNRPTLSVRSSLSKKVRHCQLLSHHIVRVCYSECVDAHVMSKEGLSRIQFTQMHAGKRRLLRLAQCQQ